MFDSIPMNARELTLDEIAVVSGGIQSAPRTKDNPDGYIPEITVTAPPRPLSFESWKAIFGTTSETVGTELGAEAGFMGNGIKSTGSRNVTNTFTDCNGNLHRDPIGDPIACRSLYNQYVKAHWDNIYSSDQGL